MSQWPSVQAALLFGTRVAETILASVHERAHSQAGHMDASDLIKTLPNTLRGGGRPHMAHALAARPGPETVVLGDAQFDTIRIGLLKVAARVTETATRIRIAFAAACPEAMLFRGIALSLRPAGP